MSLAYKETFVATEPYGFLMTVLKYHLSPAATLAFFEETAARSYTISPVCSLYTPLYVVPYALLPLITVEYLRATSVPSCEGRSAQEYVVPIIATARAITSAN